jgi:hypothetical protein
MRNRDPGYSISFDRKKQYEQSRLQTAPVGLASRWNAAGASRIVETVLTTSVSMLGGPCERGPGLEGT